MIDTVLLVIIALAMIIGVILLAFGRVWKHSVEKTPSGRSSNLVMIFEQPPDSKNELFKQAMIGHKTGIYLEKDFDEDIPTFFARPFLDYILVDRDEEYDYYLCRLNKEGYPVISEKEWVKTFVDRKEVKEVYDEETEKTRLFVEEQKLDLKKKFSRESEETYLKEKENNVEKSLRDLSSRSIECISSEIMDEEFAETKYAPKPREQVQKKKRRLSPEMEVRQEEGYDEES